MDFSGLNEIRGLKFMPVRANKMPIIKNWQQSTERRPNSKNCGGFTSPTFGILPEALIARASRRLRAGTTC